MDVVGWCYVMNVKGILDFTLHMYSHNTNSTRISSPRRHHPAGRFPLLL